MAKSTVDRNVLLYKIYTAFSEPLFWGPILIIAFQRLAGMSLEAVFYIESVVLLLVVLLDIPAGYLADRVGQKKVLIAGRALLVVDMYLFSTMQSLEDAIIANLVWAVGVSLQSGADTGLIYNLLKNSGQENIYSKIKGQAVGYRLFLASICSVITGMLAEVDLRFTLQLSVPFVVVPFLVSFFFTEPARPEPVEKRTTGSRSVLLRTLSKPEILWVIIFTSITGALSQLVFFTSSPYFELAKVEIIYFGYIAAGFNLVAWVFSYYAHVVHRKLGEFGTLVFMSTTLTLPLVIMGSYLSWYSAFLVLIPNIYRGLALPLLSEYMNRNTPSVVRTTVLSVGSTAGCVIKSGALAGYGYLTGYLAVDKLVFMLGVFGLVVSLGLSVVYYKVEGREK